MRNLVYVHGVGSTGDIWHYQTQAIEGALHLSVELRGNGVHPDPPVESITRENYAQDVLDFADQSGVERFHYVGCSLGGVVGFELWKRAPQRIASMTIVDSFAKYPDGDQYAANIIAAVQEFGSMHDFATARVEKLLLPGLPPQRRTETVEQMACKSVEAYMAATKATWTGDYREVLPTISVPTLVIHGAKDVIVSRALDEEIADRIPDAQLAIIEDAGHVSNADAPERFNQLLEEFLDRVESTRA